MAYMCHVVMAKLLVKASIEGRVHGTGGLDPAADWGPEGARSSQLTWTMEWKTASPNSSLWKALLLEQPSKKLGLEKGSER